MTLKLPKKTNLPAFATASDAKINHDLFVAREFHLQLVKLGNAYNLVRSEAGDGAFAATCRYAVQLARGLGIPERQFFAVLRACWEDPK